MAKYLNDSEGMVRAIASTNLGLEKPLTADNYDIGVHNRNMDKIDVEVNNLKNDVAKIELTATNVSISDTENLFVSDKVEGALAEVMKKAGANETSISTLNDKTDATNNILNPLKTKVDNGQNFKLTGDNGNAFVISNGNINDIRGTNTTYIGENIEGAPVKAPGSWWTINSFTQMDYGHQIATEWHGDKVYIRNLRSNSWTPWREL